MIQNLQLVLIAILIIRKARRERRYVHSRTLICYYGVTNSRVITLGDSRYAGGALLAELWEADNRDMAALSMFF